MRVQNTVTHGFCLLSLACVAAAKEKDPVSLDTIRINSGPLTTTFTPPATCLKEIKTDSPDRYYPNLYVGCEGPGGDECCPDGWASNRYFSPGVCPAGYQACTLPTTTQREETTNLCCPSSFDCPKGVMYYECQSLLNTYRTASYTNKGTPTVEVMRVVYATPIQIRFKATDSSVVPIPTASVNLPPPPVELSTGAKVGIGVGVSVAVIGLLALLCYTVPKWRARRSRARFRDSTNQGTMLMSMDPPNAEEAPPPYGSK